MTLASPDRRTLLRTAVWAAPALVATSTAPAFATSGGPGLTVDPGNTAIDAISSHPTEIWLGPNFDRFTIQSEEALAAHDLKVALTVASPTGPAYLFHREGNTDRPAPWVTAQAPGRREETLVFSYPSAVAANVPIPLSGGLALVVDNAYHSINDFTVTVTVTATGATPVVLTFTHPTA